MKEVSIAISGVVISVALMLWALSVNNERNNNVYLECLKTQEKIANTLAANREKENTFRTYSIPDCKKS
jgi:hypothetical protein